MSEISTVDELDALPVGTQLVDRLELEWIKLDNGRWDLAEPEQRGESSWHVCHTFGPFTVIEREPDAEAGEHDPGDCGPCADHAVELAQDGAR